MNDIGNLIKQKRLALGLTLEDVAQRVGVGKSTVRKWEEGIIKSIRSDKLEALADVLQISPVSLVPGTKKKAINDISLVTVGSNKQRTLPGNEDILKVLKVEADPELKSMLRIWKVSSPKARKAAVEVLKVMSDTKDE